MADDPAEVATDAEIQQRFGRVTGLPPARDDPVPDVEPARRPRLAAFDPGRRGVRALAMVAAAVVCIAAFIAWQARPRAMPMPQATALPASAAAPASSTASVVVVAVTGRVRKPGLIRLPSGSRVADAIEAAGGVLPDTDLSFINLARKVVDGELIVVGVTPPPGAAGGAPGATGAPGALVNLNTATVAELQTLPGIGAVLAQRIIDHRTKHGQFRSVDDLRQVEGIGEAKFAQLKDRVTV
jgi:competence protein ComEA